MFGKLMVVEIISEYSGLLKIIYSLTLIFICSLIFLRSDRLFKISDYQGLRYLRNAFLFYGIGFFFKFILSGMRNPLSLGIKTYYLTVGIFAKFFFVLASFFLFYSLIWKHIEREKNYHSIFNLRMVPLYLISCLIVLLDSMTKIGIFELSQVLIFLIMTMILFSNLSSKNLAKRNYFFVMVIGLFANIVNFISFVRPEFFGTLLKSYLYILNSAFFLFFFYFSYRATRR